MRSHEAIHESIDPNQSPAWRRVTAAALVAGLPVPALSASLSWLDTLTTAHGSADLIQALRDAFGAHGYELRRQPGVVAHGVWSDRAGAESERT